MCHELDSLKHFEVQNIKVKNKNLQIDAYLKFNQIPHYC